MPKTKPFIVATAGATVDGRTITDQELADMATSYNPATYTAGVNIEHIRGVSGMAPFRNYGDVLSLSLGEVEVDMNGRKERRKALYAVADLTEEAKALIDQGQKKFPSIEIRPNFGGNKFSYLEGLALTDSPAAIATEPVKFNRALPGALRLSSEEAIAIELDNESEDPGSAKGLLAGMANLFNSFADKFAAPAPKAEVITPPENPPATASLDFTALRPLLEDMGKTFSQAIEAGHAAMSSQIKTISDKVAKLEEVNQQTPPHAYSRRPLANGNTGGDAKYEF